MLDDFVLDKDVFDKTKEHHKRKIKKLYFFKIINLCSLKDPKTMKMQANRLGGHF